MVNGMSDLIVFVCKKGIVQLMTHLVTLADSSSHLERIPNRIRGLEKLVNYLL